MRRRLDINEVVIVTVSSTSVSLGPKAGATATIQVYKNGVLATDGGYGIDTSGLSYCQVIKSGETVTIRSTTSNTSTSAVSRGILKIEGVEIQVSQSRDYVVTYNYISCKITRHNFYFNSRIMFTEVEFYGSYVVDDVYASGRTERRTVNNRFLTGLSTYNIPSVGSSVTDSNPSNSLIDKFSGSATFTRTGEKSMSVTFSVSGKITPTYSGSASDTDV